MWVLVPIALGLIILFVVGAFIVVETGPGGSSSGGDPFASYGGIGGFVAITGGGS